MNQPFFLQVEAYGDFDSLYTEGIYFHNDYTKKDIIELNKEFVRMQQENMNFIILNEYDNSFNILVAKPLRETKKTVIKFEGNNIVCSDIFDIRFNSCHYADFLLSKGFAKLKTESIIVNCD